VSDIAIGDRDRRQLLPLQEAAAPCDGAQPLHGFSGLPGLVVAAPAATPLELIARPAALIRYRQFGSQRSRVARRKCAPVRTIYGEGDAGWAFTRTTCANHQNVAPRRPKAARVGHIYSHSEAADPIVALLFMVKS